MAFAVLPIWPIFHRGVATMLPPIQKNSSARRATENLFWSKGDREHSMLEAKATSAFEESLPRCPTRGHKVWQQNVPVQRAQTHKEKVCFQRRNRENPQPLGAVKKSDVVPGYFDSRSVSQRRLFFHMAGSQNPRRFPRQDRSLALGSRRFEKLTGKKKISLRMLWRKKK